MPIITLPRTGDRPLQFQGQEIASSDTRMISGQQANRWHELSLYQTEVGKYVIAIGYRTQWQGELEHDSAIVCGDQASFAEELKQIDPLAHLVGFPPGPQYAEKQARIERDITARFAAAVTEVLMCLDPEQI
ncbi:MAG: hypothetical protein AB9919_06855 [Geobacteraceae bacterium]